MYNMWEICKEKLHSASERMILFIIIIKSSNLLNFRIVKSLLSPDLFLFDK